MKVQQTNTNIIAAYRRVLGRGRVARRRPLRMLVSAAATIALSAGLMWACDPTAMAADDEWDPDPGYTSTDNGDGTYRVPLLNADVPDVSVERLPASESRDGRDAYYMVSTTMHLSPGAPIMKSYDLVNWEIVNYVFNRLDISDSFSLRNGKNSYGQGQWATSIRYHDGKWYVTFNTNNLGGSYLYITDDVEDGAWERIPLGKAYHDPSLFFDTDGTPYIFYGSGSTSAVKLSADFRTVIEEYPEILRPADYPDAPTGGLFEGAQVSYIDGQYYITIITWPPGEGRQVVLFRSDELLGRYATTDGSNPYEARGVLDSNGFAQGNLVPVEGEDGQLNWWGMFFRDSFPLGRIPALIPATWHDGWPVFGDNGNVPVGGSFPKPITLSPDEERLAEQKSLVVSDDFANDAPRREYMDEVWTIPERPAIDESLVGVELVDNGGFEDGQGSWQAHDEATLSTSTDAAAGRAALLVTERGTTGSGPAQDLSGKLQHDVTYDVSAKVKYDNPASPATKQFIITMHYGSNSYTNLARVTAEKGEWASIEGSFTVPSDRNLDSALIFVETPWTSNSNAQSDPDTHLMDFSLDEVSVIGRPFTNELPDENEVAPTDSQLAPQWQWNHAPDNRYWSLTKREGWLRLTTGKVVTGEYRYGKFDTNDELAYLEEARNTLSQRTFGPRQSVETKLDISAMKDGDVAGLAVYNRNFTYVAVKRVDGVNRVGVVNRSLPFTATIDQDEIEAFLPGSTVDLGSATEVHLKADLDFASPTGQLWTTFYYSLDGLEWTQLGDRVGPQAFDGSLSHFMGHRVGLFNYATQEAGGWVDFDHFLLSDVLTSEAKPLDTSDLDAAIAHARGLRAAEYPQAQWAQMERALARAETARAGEFGTQNQIDAPERALSLELARLAVERDLDPELTVTAETRCVADTVVIAATVRNDDDVPLAIRLESEFGGQTIETLSPGRGATRVFSTRQGWIAPGEISVRSSILDRAERPTAKVAVPYEARACR